MNFKKQILQLNNNRKIVLLILFVFFIQPVCFSQNKTPTVFLYENITQMSRDSILKAGQLRISDSTYEIKKYTYILEYYGEQAYFKYGLNSGSKFSQEFTTTLNEKSSRGTLLIVDVFIQKKNSDEPIRKLPQTLNIFFRTLYK